MEISFITVSTTDIDGSIAFYEKILDFKKARRFSPAPGMEIAFVEDQRGHQIEFIRDGRGTTFSGTGISIGFFVKNVDEVKKHLEKHGVEILYGPVTTGGGVRLLHARDINGLTLGFVQQP